MIEKVFIVGSGVMGVAAANLCATSNYKATIFSGDREHTANDNGF